MLAIAPSAPVMSLLAMSNCRSVTAAMTTSATIDGSNATRSRSRAWRVPSGRLSTGRAAPRVSSRARSRRTRGSDYDGVGPDCEDDDDCGDCDDCGGTGTCVVGAELPGGCP